VEVLEGTGAGLLYPPGNAGALAAALSRVLDEPDLAKASREAGARLVHEVYSWDAVAAATVPRYGALLVEAKP
jgi:glycosyltransferase involved in cell wall biosynthesis